ncbi:hypothetical protein J6590_021704 [Homalodisca vitripennis]|nr:hypothetical protein J6590_021704 [Homalodisca vitripennis]
MVGKHNSHTLPNTLSSTLYFQNRINLIHFIFSSIQTTQHRPSIYHLKISDIVVLALGRGLGSIFVIICHPISSVQCTTDTELHSLIHALHTIFIQPDIDSCTHVANRLVQIRTIGMYF